MRVSHPMHPTSRRPNPPDIETAEATVTVIVIEVEVSWLGCCLSVAESRDRYPNGLQHAAARSTQRLRAVRTCHLDH